MRNSGWHARFGTGRTRTVLVAALAAAALVMAACTPPDTGTTNAKPIAHAAADVVTGTAPLTVNFSSAGSTDPDGTIASYRWDFGDGLSNQANPTHTYNVPGLYVATLTVTDSAGATGSATVTITVGSGSNQSPVAVVAPSFCWRSRSSSRRFSSALSDASRGANSFESRSRPATTCGALSSRRFMST